MTLENRRHYAIFAVSVVLSLGGIVLCAVPNYWGLTVSDGGRGGAIAVIFSFLALFANRPYGPQLFKLLTKDKNDLLNTIAHLRGKTSSANDEITILKESIEALQSSIRIEAEGQNKINRFLSASAAVGTIAWGFGDWFASWLAKLFEIIHHIL